ncbi:MAG: ribosomal protein S18-alanine N-acetyltransferase [Oscillospiraceae bacterium]|nr:ribosomal protein S18-alanine N-acetyltransferase [Oscillospiraceae bacterium]
MTQRDNEMKGGFEIAEACSADAVGIAQIERECFSEPWSEESVSDEISAENSLFFVCRDAGGNIVGYVSGRDNFGEFYVNNIAVTCSARFCGIGTALMREISDGAQKRGCEFITLEVRNGNTSARRLYEKCGFSVVGQRLNFYRSPTEDAVLYTKVFSKTENKK